MKPADPSTLRILVDILRSPTCLPFRHVVFNRTCPTCVRPIRACFGARVVVGSTRSTTTAGSDSAEGFERDLSTTTRPTRGYPAAALRRPALAAVAPVSYLCRRGLSRALVWQLANAVSARQFRRAIACFCPVRVSPFPQLSRLFRKRTPALPRCSGDRPRAQV